MTKSPSPPVAVHALVAALDREVTLTVPFLERLPDDRFDWQPHPRSMTLGQLVSHLMDLPSFVTDTFAFESYDVASATEAAYSPPVESSAEALARWSTNATNARAALVAASAAALAQVWTLSRGAHVIFSLPRAQVVRETILDHLIHHRAQLGLYLRLLDVPVPGTYGPTADEAEFDFDLAAHDPLKAAR